MDFKNKKEALEKVKKIINKKLSKLNDDEEFGEYKVHDFGEDSILYQNFKTWGDSQHKQGIKIKEINLVNNNTKFSYLGYFPENTYISGQTLVNKECYLCIRGGFTISIENDTYYVNGFSEFCVPKNIKHSIKFIKDSYVIVYTSIVK